jgi:glyoxylase-like metal-dependent hydrolase (beta-lactamase superfamily II)
MNAQAPAQLFVKIFPVGPLQCNCTVLGNKITGEAIVVDPGGDAQKILALLQEEGLKVTRILHTHAHFDHFLAAGELHEHTGAPLCLHKADQFLWDNLEMQCGLYNIPFKPVPAPQHWLEHEEELPLTDCAGKALFTPGHTPGSMSFVFEAANLLVAGDTLFKGSIGRTDLWGGDYPTIERSIKTQLYTLDENLKVVTGHGPATVLGDEMRNNPHVRA